MPDQVTITTSKNWFSRIIGSIVGLFLGLALVLIAFPLLWWNEGRSVKTARGLKEGASAVVEVAADRVDAANEGRLVHLTGPAAVQGAVTDPEFNISAEAIKIVRTVEMFQWQEEKKTSSRKKFGGSEETRTTYTYRTAWGDRLNDSSSFKEPAGHENPSSIPWESKTVTANPVTVGAFTLSTELVDLLDQRDDRPVVDADAQALPGEDLKVWEGRFYKGANPRSPSVGDVRIRYQVVRPQSVSLVAVQRGASFEAFHAKSGTSILFMEPGTVSADSMFRAAESHNTLLAWLIRAGGLVLMWVGIALVLRPLAVVGSVIPLIGRLLSAGIGVISFSMALCLSLATMALAWVAYRPLLAVTLIAIAVGSVWLLARRHKRARGRVVPPPIPVGS